MIPRKRSRLIPFGFCLGLIALALSVFIQRQQAFSNASPIQGMRKIYCSSGLDGPVVYFSNILDANSQARSKISILPLNFAFKNYLVEEYDFKSSAPYSIGCRFFETLSEAEANKRQLVSQARQANKQVVEVNWNPGPIIEVPQADESVAIGPKEPAPTHTICAVGHETTTYFSAVFDSSGARPNPAWDDAFNDFLMKKYGANGLATCTIMSTVREAERLLKDRVTGLRVNNHKAVETGWRYNASVVITKPAPKPTPKVDDDPEPTVQRPAPRPPSADIRDFATKEVPAALASCQNDRMISGAFDCYCIQRAVYNYRMAHAGEPGQPEPLANLFAKDKLDCSGCIAPFVDMWATSHAQSQSLPRPVAECVAKRFVASLRAKPHPSHVKELFSSAMAACK